MNNTLHLKQFTIIALSFILPISLTAQTQHQKMMHSGMHGTLVSTPLTEPGNDAFGTIQEAIRALEADSTTDWSKVDLEALRQHLIDMNNFTLHVDVLSQNPIPNGVDIVVKGNTPAAQQSLKRVLAAHPPMLKKETGWTMDVKPKNDQYELVVTSKNPAEVNKIRGLGYIGLMAYGMHHQMHHWMIVHGINPHKQ